MAFWHLQSERFSVCTHASSLSLNDCLCQLFVFWWLECFVVEWRLTQSCCLGCAAVCWSESQLCLSTAMSVLSFTAPKSPCERLINKGSLSLGSSASLPPQTGNRDNLPMLNTKILYPSKWNTLHFPLRQPAEHGWQQHRLQPPHENMKLSCLMSVCAGPAWR